MGYAVYERDGRDMGYGVPAECDHPRCSERIDRGLAYICGGGPDSDHGCHLFFCHRHLTFRQPRGLDHSIELCPRCRRYRAPYQPKPDLVEWMEWKLHDDSWAEWRRQNRDQVFELMHSTGFLS